MSSDLWSVERLQPNRAPEVCGLFERVFGNPMSMGLWSWKYAGGRGLAIVALDKAGHIVGHYGGLPRPVSFFGEAKLAVQIADVMVAPEVRGVLTRTGPFAMTTGAFLDEFIGYDAPYLLGFGFPSERHLRIARKLNLYASVDTVSELAWPNVTIGGDKPMASQVAPIDWSSDATAAQLDALWVSMQGCLSDFVVPVRDANWWRHRFANHPSHVYRCFWLYGEGSPHAVGAFVLKPSIDAGGVWELMDWIGGVQYIPAVVEQARRLAHSQAASLSGWFSSCLVARLVDTGCTVTDIGVRVPTSIRRPGPPSEQVNGRWWLTGGDTDFR